MQTTCNHFPSAARQQQCSLCSECVCVVARRDIPLLHPHMEHSLGHTHNHERGIHLHSLCLPHSHVSSLLLLMNTCAAINPFFMCKSHVRNYLVQLSHMAGRTERGSTRWGRGPKDVDVDGTGATLCQAQSKEIQLYFYINITHVCVQV